MRMIVIIFLLIAGGLSITIPNTNIVAGYIKDQDMWHRMKHRRYSDT